MPLLPTDNKDHISQMRAVIPLVRFPNPLALGSASESENLTMIPHTKIHERIDSDIFHTEVFFLNKAVQSFFHKASIITDRASVSLAKV